MNESALLARVHREPPALLLEIEQHGRRDEVPLVGRETGRLLSTLVHAMQANRILEIGTGYGLSTLWMALALPPAGRIWTIDDDLDRTRIARQYFERAQLDEHIDIAAQPALEILPSLPVRKVDIVFIDAALAEYEEYLESCIPMLKLSGLIIFDRLLTGNDHSRNVRSDDDEEVRALRAFHRVFLNHPALDATILPIGAGVGIGARVE